MPKTGGRHRGSARPFWIPEIYGDERAPGTAAYGVAAIAGAAWALSDVAQSWLQGAVAMGVLAVGLDIRDLVRDFAAGRTEVGRLDVDLLRSMAHLAVAALMGFALVAVGQWVMT